MAVIHVLTAQEMRAAEQALFATGIPEYDVMERAGAAAASLILRIGGRRDTLVLCGPGNNGGDGYVIARLLAEAGLPVRVAASAEPTTPSAQRARQGWTGPVEAIATAEPAAQLVDALFGTGLSRGLDEDLAATLSRLAAHAARRYAIDLPSGVDTDSGACLSPVPRFDICIGFGALKPAHLLYPAAGHVGQVILADIGIDAAQARAVRLAKPTVRAPDFDTHKYTRGLVAIVGGAMPGAAHLAAEAAARGGAGYVRLLAHGEPPATKAIVAIEAGGTRFGDALSDTRVGAALVGPGLGRDAQAALRLEAVLSAGRPTVIDADALILLEDRAVPANSILTPHEGEFVKLFGDLPGSKIDRTRTAAQKVQAVVVYKGADTVIAAPDGRVAIGGSITPWLSTAGTGDVLAGLAAARLAQVGDPFEAACQAVWLHGEAARLAGPAFVADDLINHLSAALGACL